MRNGQTQPALPADITEQGGYIYPGEDGGTVVDFPVPMQQAEEEQRANLVESQLGTDDIIQDIRHFLRGEQLDPDTQKYIEVKNSSLVNEQGMFGIINMIRPRLSRPVILGNMEDHEARLRAEQFETELAYQLVIHGDEWAVKDRDIIVDAIGDLIFANFTRPVGAGALRALGRMSMVHEQYVDRPYQRGQENEKKGGLFNQFKIGR